MAGETRRKGLLQKVLNVAASILLLSAGAYGGDLEPSSPPGGGASYSLEDIYMLLESGIAGPPGTETEPGDGPPVGGTQHTLDQIMEIAPEIDNSNGAIPSDVTIGRTFWGLTSKQWGLKTGTNDGSGACNEALAPKTGCTECDPEECEGTLQDGDLQRGLSWPIPRFTDNGDGTVTDNLTMLVWLKSANCFGEAMVWADALEFANSLHDGWTGDGSGGDCDLSDASVAGDWRLPNIRELSSLIHWGFSNPSLPDTHGAGQWVPGDPFIDVQSADYWSGTVYSDKHDIAWRASLKTGWIYEHYKYQKYYAWPVRDGQ